MDFTDFMELMMKMNPKKKNEEYRRRSFFEEENPILKKLRVKKTTKQLQKVKEKNDTAERSKK